ncbi:MAG: ABC transporter permease, partial [Acidimicrobiales bacterium]|nr:ABC transporter permease [Acidimicrobiales bacterium]
MLRVSLASLWFHRRRFLATGLAVILGVGFLVATSTISDAIESASGRWRDSSAETDVVIRGPALYTTNQGRTQYDSVPESIAAQVAAMSGVEAVNARNFTNQVVLLDRRGGQVTGWQGRFVRSWPSAPRFALNEIEEGRPPRALGELTMDASMASDLGFGVGDEVTVLTHDGRRTMRIVGTTGHDVVDFGDGRPGAMSVSLEQAQVLAGERGRLDGLDVIAAPGVSASELADRIETEASSKHVRAMTMAEVEEEQAAEFHQRTRFFTALLLLFSAIALFVSAFIIANTFGILVSQRTREHALLRAVGASRAQLALSVLAEAAVVGVVAGGLGVAAGVGLAWGALNGLGGLGLPLPGKLPLRVGPTQALEAVIAGLGVTVAAASLPAVRAMKVRPLVSLRAADVDTADRSRSRIVSGIAAAGLGGALAAPAFTSSPPLSAMNRIGIGLGLLLIAVIILCPTITGPAVRLLGASLLRGGAVGQIAAENARRNPRRTAATISALTVGVALVGFITVLASSAQTSVKAQLRDVFRGDFLVAPSQNRTRLGVDPVLADRLAAVEGVAATTALTGTTGQVTLPDGPNLGGTIAGIDPESYQRLFRLELSSGDIGQLSADSILVNRVVARDNGLSVGDRVEVISYETKRASFRIAGTFDEQSLLAPWATTIEGMDRLTARRSTQLVAVDVAGVQPAQVRPLLDKVVADFPTMTVQDREQYSGDTVEDIDEILNLLYALLAVSIVIALVGITNTLSLSVHERTREIGL